MIAGNEIEHGNCYITYIITITIRSRYYYYTQFQTGMLKHRQVDCLAYHRQPGSGLYIHHLSLTRMVGLD